MWSLNSTIVESMCVNWRKALRPLWRVDPRTHCDLITAVSNQIPFILSLKKIFIKFISACLSTSNCIVKIKTELLYVTRCLVQGIIIENHYMGKVH